MMLDQDRRLRICIATRAPFLGGAEVAAERLALGLRDAGHDVVLLLAQAGAVLDRYQTAGLRCVVIPMDTTDARRFWRHLISTYRLKAFFARERFDIVHANDLPTHQMVAKAARQARVPRLCHHRFPFDGPTIDWLDKFGAERHVFVSNALMEEMCRASAKLAASSRAVVHDGLPAPTLPSAAERAMLRARLGLPADRVVVLFAGQIIERKGVADLIYAWSHMDLASQKRGKLVLIGDDLQGRGAYRSKVEELAKEVDAAVEFRGFQHNVPEWLSAADIAVVPSHVEPLGNATLEAMAHALPVVGTKVGGIPEMVVHEETGLLVPPHASTQLSDAIARLIRDADLRAAFGQLGRARCEELFSLKRHIEAVLAQYADTMNV